MLRMPAEAGSPQLDWLALYALRSRGHMPWKMRSRMGGPWNVKGSYCSLPDTMRQGGVLAWTQ